MANILRDCAAANCDRTFRHEHGAAVPGGPFPGTGASKGDVRRCEHGKVWRFRYTDTRAWSWFDIWDRLSPIWEPITYRRAVRALAHEATCCDDDCPAPLPPTGGGA